MDTISLVCSKGLYHIVDILSKSQFDSLLDKFNNPADDEYFEILKIQNTEANKLFPCYVIYIQYLKEV